MSDSADKIEQRRRMVVDALDLHYLKRLTQLHAEKDALADKVFQLEEEHSQAIEAFANLANRFRLSGEDRHAVAVEAVIFSLAINADAE